jgi:5-methylcytosine-specific restriction protein A
MPMLPPSYRPPHARSSARIVREYEGRRRARSPWRAWYGLAIWQKLRAVQLADEPLCQRCLVEGITRAADTVHHKKPHRGDWALFADPFNLESVCKPCHDLDIQREETAAKRGGGVGILVTAPPRTGLPSTNKKSRNF